MTVELHRSTCHGCRRPANFCYCSQLRPEPSSPAFAILMHPHEVKKRIGTGRLAHRCLSNSTLWVGNRFSDDCEVVRFLARPELRPVLLFPGNESLPIDQLSPLEKTQWLSDGRETVIVVLDATWSIASKMLRESPFLQSLPRISFSPGNRSRFLVRRQPRAECLSTVEAIHRVLDILGTADPHRRMLDIFHGMVDRQLAFGPDAATRCGPDDTGRPLRQSSESLRV